MTDEEITLSNSDKKKFYHTLAHVINIRYTINIFFLTNHGP